MSLQWTAVAVFLYAEVAFVLLMMLPWIRPPTWSKIFKSRLVRSVEGYSYIFTYMFGGILALLLLDAFREVRKYSDVDQSVDLQHHVPASDTIVHMRLFRAQRNLYISGFAVFLWFVIRRMVQLLITEARLIASADASYKQAASASAAAKHLMEQKDPLKEKEKEKEKSTQSAEKMKEVISELRQRLTETETERNAMRDQADEVKKEYDELIDEHSRLQKVLDRTGDMMKNK